MGYRVDREVIFKLIRIGKWSEPRFAFVCQLLEMIRKDDVNDTSGEDGLALLGRLVGESQLRLLKLALEIMFSNMVPLVSVELEYHAEWCAFKSASSYSPGKEGNLLCKSFLGVCRG